MDDLTAEDEKKPFEAEHNDDDAQPDPDEELMLDKGNGRVWLVKVSVPCPWAVERRVESATSIPSLDSFRFPSFLMLVCN
jgi:hypothetical protein